MATLFQDTFTDTNGTVLSSHTGEGGVTYTRHSSFSVATITIEANRAVKDGDAATAVYYASVVGSSLFYEISCDIVDKSAVQRSMGVFGWIDTASDTMIGVRRQNDTTWQLLKIVGGTATSLDTEPATFSAEAVHTLKLRRIPETNDFEWFLDGASLGVFTITDAEFQSIGKIGIRATNTGGAGVAYHLDNLSASSVSAPKALFRGRNFPFFDDEEVNRFEFWPGIAAATVLERSAALSASAAIESAGTSFSVFEASASVAASADISTAGQRELIRSAVLNATGAVTVSGLRVLERAVLLAAVAAIESSGESFALFESSVSLSATGNIDASGTSFSVVEAAVLVAGTAAVEVAGSRVIERSISCVATAAIETSAVSFTVFESAVLISASASIDTSAIFFSVLERQVLVTATATITATSQRELQRQADFSGLATIVTAGQVGDGPVVHERSAALDAVGAIASAGEFFSIFTGVVEVSASAAITTTHQRELQRLVQFSAIGTISCQGTVVAEAVERAVGLAATATISVGGAVHHPTPPSRTFMLESSQRTMMVIRDLRSSKPE